MNGIAVASCRAELPEEQTLYNELCQWIEQAIMSLPDNLRQVKHCVMSRLDSGGNVLTCYN